MHAKYCTALALQTQLRQLLCCGAQSTAQESQEQTRSTAKQVAELQAQLADIADQHNKRTEELYVKFAAVLNEKKQKCVVLKQALETAQATLQVLVWRQ